MGRLDKYRSASQVSWTVEKRGLVLLNSATGAVCTLAYPEAALWDLISRCESCQRIIPALSAITSLEPAAAEQLIQVTVRGWVQAGFLVREAGNG